MKKFLGVIAVTLILLSLFSSSFVMAAGQCSKCKKYNTHETYDEIKYGMTEYFCYKYVKSYYRLCGDCSYREWIRNEDGRTRSHTYTYYDLGCSNNQHTWKFACSYCSYSEKTMIVDCPGPPHCVSPMASPY
jgi:hypothetical protein